jgi:hypothetical protein
MARTRATVVMAGERKLPPPPSRVVRSKWTAVFEQIVGRKSPVLVAMFESENGAANLRRRIQAGKTLVPGGVGDWEIVARPERDEEGRKTGRSELHAQWRG